MPRLLDLLEYLATPGLEDIWLMLDIKVRVSQPRVVIDVGALCIFVHKLTEYEGR